MDKVTCPEGHSADALYYRRVGETDTIICCRKCEELKMEPIFEELKGAPAYAQWLAEPDRAPSWWELPAPPLAHRCRADFIGQGYGGETVCRCACGAIRVGMFGYWSEKNSRKTEELKITVRKLFCR